MRNCHRLMLLGGALLLCALVFLPLAGVAAPSSPLLLGLLMVGCCLLPVLLTVFGRDRESRGEEPQAGTKGTDSPGAKGDRKACH